MMPWNAPRQRPRLRPIWLLLLILALAAGLRLARLDVLPPGISRDEAFNGVDASRILTDHYWPLYFAANNGREPLMIYLQAVSVALLGRTSLALRIVSAFVGIATVAAVYACARTLFSPSAADAGAQAQDGLAPEWAALIAAAVLAVSYWHLSLSRLGLRAVLLPLTGALAIAFFWRGWTRRRLRDYAWAAVWLAAGMYAYTAARFLPVVIAAFVAVELALDAGGLRRGGPQRAEWRGRGAGLLLACCLLAALMAPLALTLWHDPALIATRVADVSIWSAPQSAMPGSIVQRLAANVVKVAGSFYVRGDANLRHNLPGRPFADLLVAALLTVGLATALGRIGWPRERLLLLWLAIMLLPAVFSTDAPHILRMAGALPPMALLAGLGASTLCSISALRSHAAPAGLALLVAVLLVSGGLTVRDYFGRWAGQPGLGRAFDLRWQLAAEAAAQQLAPGTSQRGVALPIQAYFQPQTEFALGRVPQAEGDASAILQDIAERLPIDLVVNTPGDLPPSMALLWRDGGALRQLWIQPAEGDGPAPASQTGAPGEGAQAFQPDDETVLRSPIHQPGWPQAVVVELTQDQPLTLRRIRYPLDARFANGMRLVGYDINPVEAPGGPSAFRLSLFWQASASDEPAAAETARLIAQDFDVFAHLVDAGGVLANANGPLGPSGYTLDWLRPGDTAEDLRTLIAPATAANSPAHVEAGLYEYRAGQAAGSQERIAIVDAQGRPVADQVTFGGAWLGSAPPANLEPGFQPLDIQFEDGVKLAGWRVGQDPTQSHAVQLELAWQTTDRPVVDYTAFVHLLDAQGQIVAQQDQPLDAAGLPTHLWPPGQQSSSTHRLKLPAGLDLSQLTLRIGLYEPISGRQARVVTVEGGSWKVEDTFLLVPLSRVYGGPEVASPG